MYIIIEVSIEEDFFFPNRAFKILNTRCKSYKEETPNSRIDGDDMTMLYKIFCYIKREVKNRNKLKSVGFRLLEKLENMSELRMLSQDDHHRRQNVC